MEGGPTAVQQGPRQTHLVESLQEQDVQGANSINEDSVELDVLDDGATYERILPRVWHKVQVFTTVEGDGDLEPFKVLGGGGWDHHDLLGCEFLLPPWLIWVGATIDVVDLLMSFGEVTLGLFGLFLLIGPFGHLEHRICETLASIAVSGLMLSLGVKMHMQSRKPSNSPDLGQYYLLNRGRSIALTKWATFLFLLWPLDELGWSVWPDSFYSLVSRVASLARQYLLVIATSVLTS
jgi:hypothetical protein